VEIVLLSYNSANLIKYAIFVATTVNKTTVMFLQNYNNNKMRLLWFVNIQSIEATDGTEITGLDLMDVDTIDHIITLDLIIVSELFIILHQ